jgi:hypothetical protein
MSIFHADFCGMEYLTSDAVVDTAEIKNLEGLQLTAILHNHCPLAAFVPFIQMLPIKREEVDVSVSVDRFSLTHR